MFQLLMIFFGSGILMSGIIEMIQGPSEKKSNAKNLPPVVTIIIGIVFVLCAVFTDNIFVAIGLGDESSRAEIEKRMEQLKNLPKIDAQKKAQEYRAKQKTKAAKPIKPTTPTTPTKPTKAIKPVAPKEDTPSHSDILFVASGKYFPPMFDLRDNMPKGFDIDLAKEIGRRMGKSKTVFHSYKSPRRSLSSKGNAFAIAAISITTSRRQENLFSIPYIETDYVLVKHNRTSPSSRLLESTCSVGPNPIYQKLLRKTGCQIKKFSSNNKAMQALKNKQVDYSVTEKFRVESQKIAIYETVKILGQDTLGIAFEKGNESLKYKIDNILKNMKKDGFLENLRARHHMH